MNERLFPSYHPKVGTIEIYTFLQKFNVTGKRDIEMFIELSKHDSPTVPYKTAISLTKSQDDEFAFTNFIQRMEGLHIAIMRKSIIPSTNTLIPDYIRLCDDDAPVFFCEYISELTNQAYVSSETNLPTKRQFKILGHEIPKKLAIDIDLNHIKQAFANAGKEVIKDSDSIYSLKIFRNEPLYCTQDSIPKLLDIAMTRLKQVLEDNNVLPNITKAIELNLIEVKEKIASDDLVAWDDFISRCYDSLPKIQENQQVSAYTDVFDYIIILNALIKPKIQQERNNVQIQKDINNFQTYALNAIFETGHGVPRDKLQDFLHKIAINIGMKDDETTDEAIKQFIQEYVTYAENPDQKKLRHETCIIMNGTCFHNKIILNIITDNFGKICDELRLYFTYQLKKYLENKLPIKENPFLSEESLEIATHQKVNEIEPMYATLLKSPILLASILTQKKPATINPSFSNMTNSKKLSLFFNLRTKEVLPWHKIFNINLTIFTEDAYTKIGRLKRYWMVFTGRYKTMLQKLQRLQKVSSVMHADTNDEKILNKKRKIGQKKQASIKAR